MEWKHTARIYTEEKAKVVAAVCGTEFYSFPAVLPHDDMKKKDELHQDEMKKRMNSSYSSNRPGAK